jgi:hypothetical protein
MGFDEFTKAMIDGKLQTFCEHHVAPDLRDQEALTYSFRKASVILYERRRSPMDPKKWARVKIARADFDENSKGWTLWTYDRNTGPRRYPDIHEAIDFDTILGEIERDPKCIIWV